MSNQPQIPDITQRPTNSTGIIIKSNDKPLSTTHTTSKPQK
ncbi:hypothetical protein SKM54_01805 [Acinetobacter faecalis]|nr:hypothetical protein [Acinetobacter faecalis]MDY6467023.1 hypothetical protein [Acinetobacter faecalis]MDY6481183.1 hypothetical protein [Acinetobacter faecalis]